MGGYAPFWVNMHFCRGKNPDFSGKTVSGPCLTMKKTAVFSAGKTMKASTGGTLTVNSP